MCPDAYVYNNLKMCISNWENGPKLLVHIHWGKWWEIWLLVLSCRHAWQYFHKVMHETLSQSHARKHFHMVIHKSTKQLQSLHHVVCQTVYGHWKLSKCPGIHWWKMKYGTVLYLLHLCKREYQFHQESLNLCIIFCTHLHAWSTVGCIIAVNS